MHIYRLIQISLLNITQSSGTSTFNLKHLREKTQHPKAQQMSCWDSGFESLTSCCRHLAVKPGYSRGLGSVPPLATADHHPWQDSKGNHDDKRCNDHIQHTPLCKQNPRDKHILAPHTIHSAHFRGLFLGKKRQGLALCRIRGWRSPLAAPPDSLGKLEIQCVNFLGSFHCVLVYKTWFPVTGKPLYRHDRRDLYTQNRLNSWCVPTGRVWSALTPLSNIICPEVETKGLCPGVIISSEQLGDSRCLALCPPWVSNMSFSARVPTLGRFTYHSCFHHRPSAPWGNSPSRTGHTRSAWWRSHSARARSSSADRLGAKTSKVN